MSNPIRDIIFKALQDSFSENVVFHTIDDKNSIIEMNYEKIAKEILKSLAMANYKIVPK